MAKIRVGILFGGKSAEHEVSLQSAKNIIEAIPKDIYEVVEIFMTNKGAWDMEMLKKVDVVFPVLHGPFGEDGTVQGLLKLAGIPFVGAGVLGSAIGMDKDVMKRLLRDAKIPIGKFQCLEAKLPNIDFENVKKGLGIPIFVKPANMGSSVGVHKVNTEKEFLSAIRDAFQFDTKVILEEFIEGREIECSVLGNKNPIASLPGEIIPTHDFYSYEAKYLDDAGAKLEIPAKLDASTTKKVQELAIQTFQVLECAGMARVDMFVKENGEIVINEINTIPGFTKISMYPKLWEASGISYSDLIDRLIQLAIERFEREKKLKTIR